jgi:hypothetical protein
LEQQQRTIDSNAALLESLRTQNTNAQAEKVPTNVTLKNNSVLLQTVQAEHAALQVVHVGTRLFWHKAKQRQERQEASDAFELEVAHLRENNKALFLETTS